MYPEILMIWRINRFHSLQVLELPGGVRRPELHQVPHPDGSLRGLPQVPQLPHGLQVFPQRPEPHQHPAPDAHRGTGQVRQLLQPQPAEKISSEKKWNKYLKDGRPHYKWRSYR